MNSIQPKAIHRALRWPLPALVAWVISWSLLLGMSRYGFSMGWGVVLASALGIGMSVMGQSWWRKLVIAAGFPVSLALTVSSVLGPQVPTWIWLLPLALLLLVYPINTWSDAPLFPTPRNALLDLPIAAQLQPGARILDAGCGLGHGLQALRLAYPQAHTTGVEWSTALYGLCTLRCPWATVVRGDMWAQDWSVFDMVYLFQRPESMPKVMAKAATMKSGAWLVSLEFEAVGWEPSAQLRAPNGKPIWLYRR